MLMSSNFFPNFVNSEACISVTIKDTAKKFGSKVGLDLLYKLVVLVCLPTQAFSRIFASGTDGRSFRFRFLTIP